MLVNVESRLLPNHVVVMSEVLKEVCVSYNILHVSVPNDSLHVCTMVQIFASRTVVGIAENFVIMVRRLC